MIPRTLRPHVQSILERHHKMAFLSGPRQVGKTTLARTVREDFSQGLYFNWDVVTDQRRLVRDPYFFESENRDPARPFLVIFDEIHKYSRWKNYLKGAWDRHHEEFRFLVTGSGRLDLFKKGGDSLLGRYLGLTLFPLTVGELAGRWRTWQEFKELLASPPPADAAIRGAYGDLLGLTGFPEPFSKGEREFYNVWYQERRKLLIREDIRDLSSIREISLLEVLAHLLPERVGSPLSINALREDVGVAFETVRDWLLLLEGFYYLFRIHPYARRLNRGLRKEAKAYLYDWGEISAPSIRFENAVALHLLKAVHSWRATGAGEIGLHYVRDKEKREADFLITERGIPLCLIECKHAEDSPSPALSYFQKRLEVPIAVQLVHRGGLCKKFVDGGRQFWIISADRWLGVLP